jgi:hypothetical protein
MIGVSMGNDRTGHRPPRVDVEISSRDIKAFGPLNDEIGHS